MQTLLKDLNVGPNKHKIAELAVSLALDRHDPHRELTSRLISDLHGPVLSTTDLNEGFNDLLGNLQDLTLDTPDAPTVSAATATAASQCQIRAFCHLVFLP